MKLIALLLLLVSLHRMRVFSQALVRADSIEDPLISNNEISDEDSWGDWSQDYRYCNDGLYAIGFNLKVEGIQDGDDDTSANSFQLICDDDSIVETGNDGEWGEWETSKCPDGEFIKGFKSKIEQWLDEDDGAFDTGDDDTALNSIGIYCTDETEIEASNGGVYGEWGSYTYCDDDAIVCGFNQRVQPKSQDHDNTALNAVRLKCCKNDKQYSNPAGYWELVFGSGGGAIIEKEVSIGITDYHEESFGTENSKSLQESLELGIEFLSTSLTAAQATTVTKTSLSSVTRTIEETWTLKCDEGKEALYQFITSVTESGMNQNDNTFKIRSKDYWCVSDNTLQPQCPFMFCADDDCQECTEELGADNR